MMASSQEASHEDSQHSNPLSQRELQLPYHRYWGTENEEIGSHADNTLQNSHRFLFSGVD